MTLHAGSEPVLRNMCPELRLILSRAAGLTTVVTEAKRCPVRLWETESQRALAVTDTPTRCLQSQRGRDPLLAPASPSQTPGPVSSTERGEGAAERKRLKRPLMAVHMCHTVVFAHPGGGSGSL